MNQNYFTLKNGQSTFYVYQPYPINNPDSIMIISHGLAEHSERYQKLCSYMSDHNILCYAITHPGHGKHTTSLGVWPKNGFFVSLNNIDLLIKHITTQYPNKKITLFGHSLGSFIALGYIEKYGEKIDACILSGSNDAQPAFISFAGNLISSIICSTSGRDKPSLFLNNLTFGSYNSHFKPAKTAFDWLSKDEHEVAKYVKDPLCGFVPSAGIFKDMIAGLNLIYQGKSIKNIPTSLPIHIIGGGKDPVGNFAKGLYALKTRLEKQQLTNVSIKVYEDNRHECHNEVNSSLVLKDIRLLLA